MNLLYQSNIKPLQGYDIQVRDDRRFTSIDPLEFRLKNLKDEKMIAVLKAVSDKFGYTPAKIPSGRGYGIACGTDAGSWVAHMAEVISKTTPSIHMRSPAFHGFQKLIL
jgi:hypothetical protein